QVRLRIDAAELRALDERVEDRGDLRASLRSRAVVVLSTDHHPAERSLRRVVVDLDARIFEEGREARPELEHVVDGFAEAVLGESALLEGPFSQSLDDGGRLGRPHTLADLERLGELATLASA